MRPPKISPAVVTINSLPDDILFRILSFVTTKEAVATSILSKRWIHLWRSVSTIDFTGITVDNVKSFLLLRKSLHSVLASRVAAAATDFNFINTFLLEIYYRDSHGVCSSCSFPYIPEWIKLVLQHKIEHLRLRFNLQVPRWCNFDDFLPALPVSIFTCKTLVSLDLRWFRADGFSFCGHEFQFPSLKTLHLEHIKFSKVEDFALLLSGCPILEDLQASRLHFFDEEISSSTVKEFKKLNLPKLTRAYMVQCWFSCFMAMLKLFSNLTSLSIETSSMFYADYFVTKEEALPLYHDIPIFHNLTYLELHNSFRKAIDVLDRCPKLQHLKLYKNTRLNQDDDDDQWWMKPIIVPQCFSSYLRTCIIQEDFAHAQSDHKMAKYILENAKILQTLTLRSQRKRSKVEKKFARCSKASPACQILVVENT